MSLSDYVVRFSFDKGPLGGQHNAFFRESQELSKIMRQDYEE